MIGRFLYYIGFLTIIFWLLAPSLFSDESATIGVSAYVVPAVGFEDNTYLDPAWESGQNLILRCPTTGSIICRIEADGTTVEHHYNYNNEIDREQITLPTELIPTAKKSLPADSCVITIIYLEN